MLSAHHVCIVAWADGTNQIAFRRVRKNNSGEMPSSSRREPDETGLGPLMKLVVAGVIAPPSVGLRAWTTVIKKCRANMGPVEAECGYFPHNFRPLSMARFDTGSDKHQNPICFVSTTSGKQIMKVSKGHNLPTLCILAAPASTAAISVSLARWE